MLRARLAAIAAAILILAAMPLTALAAAPANDDPTTATVISSLPFTESVDLSEATDENPPFPACESAAHNRVWYAYTPAAAETISVGTGNDPAVELALWRIGASVSDLSLAGCAVDGGDLVTTLSSGSTYLVSIALWAGLPFTGTVTFTHIDRPANDDVANAIQVDDANFVDGMSRATALAATFEPGETFPSCRENQSSTHSVWYRVTPATETVMSVSATRLAYIGVYDGATYPGATEVGCMDENDVLTMTLAGGHTYLVQVGVTILNYFDDLYTYFDLSYPPDNDDFEAATPIGELPFNDSPILENATLEPGEPAGCGFGGSLTVWYELTSQTDESLLASVGDYDAWIQVFTGSSVDALESVGCAPGYGGPLLIQAEAGVTYHLQVGRGSNVPWALPVQVELTPAPTVGFSTTPSDPSVFDAITFYDNTWDPAQQPRTVHWSFGDGSTSTDPNPQHRYQADGTYRVVLDVETQDGRTGLASMDVVVQTHDVAIRKLAVPTSASSGQVRQISVGVLSTRYPELVLVTLVAETPQGGVVVGSLTKQVLVRGANRTTDFQFEYAFTSADALAGKVTFTAFASILGPRDVAPADNTALATTRVNR